MKNILSENMLRFGTKNLSEATQRELVLKSIMETIDQHGLHRAIRQQLMEGQFMALTLTATIPSNTATNQNIAFTLGPLGNNAAKEYTGLIRSMTVNGVSTNSMTNQKLTGQYITGEIMSTAANIDQIKTQLLSIPANYLGTDDDINRNQATLVVVQPDPKNPTKKAEQCVISSYKVTQSTKD